MILFSQESLDGFLSRFNNERIPYISVQELAMPKTKAIILDAREREEYEVSHIKNAIYVGYDNFDLKKVTSKIKDKNQPIVVYCSLGVRSEDIAENLKKAGYVEVSNLYGGIFEWKNKGYTVYDASESETEKVHAFSERWSKFLKQGIKVYE
jgi:rhodanese-related sulfurtransferase